MRRPWIMLIFTASAAMTSAANAGQQVLFTFESHDGAWGTVHDTVMGGRSEGNLEIRDDVLQFSGNLSLENNGGFSSIRRPIDLDLSDKTGIRLRVRGDGRSYQLRLHTESRYFGRPVAYAATFATEEGRWSEIDVPFAELEAGFRGRQLDGYRFDASQIELIGILLADKQPGAFRLEIDRISAYSTTPG